MMTTREHARVTSVNVTPDYDHGLRTSYVFLDLTDGGCQGFGGLHLGTVEGDSVLEDAWKEELLQLFHVKTLEEIAGRECFALYAFPGWGESIEGLEVEGRRFTVTAFGRKYWPTKVKTRLELARKDSLDSIVHLSREINIAAARLAAIDATFRDWEKP